MNLGGGNIKLVLGIVVGLIIGVLIGMALFWGPLKVEYTGAHIYDLLPEEKATHLTLIADSYAADLDRTRAGELLAQWKPEELQQAFQDAIAANEEEGRSRQVQNLRDLQTVLSIPTTPGGAEATPFPTPVPPSGSPGFMTTLRNICLGIIAVLLVLVLIAIVVRYLSRRRAAAAAAGPAPVTVVPTTPVSAPVRPAEEWEGVGQPPLGHFITTYKLGEDTYDESFSIETPAGEFLGECGVGISETIGKNDPDKVTAFEVWLFDKSDIRTVTKVLMSDHAFHDEALRGKLAPKGEAVLAQAGVPFLLETSGLQVQVTVTDLAYGEGPLPSKSFFRQLTVELVAMAKAAA